MIKETIIMVIAFSVFTSGANAQAPRGVVYIESNVGDVPGENSVLAFKRDDNGHLTQIGEFPTGGTGVHPIETSFTNLATTLGPYDSDQSIILNRDGTRLFAVNSGSDSIAVFHVKRDGRLDAVRGSPFPSFGRMPVSLGLAGEFEGILVVVNKDYDLTRPGFDVARREPNYTTFWVSPHGKLIHIPKSTIVAGRGGGIGPGFPNPSQALIARGRLVFDTDFFGFTLHSFNVRLGGRLERAASHRTPAAEFVPHPLIDRPQGRPISLGLQAHPHQRIFYAGFVFEGRVGVYTYDRDGEFHFVRSTEAGAGICWIATNRSGDRLYTSNTLANTISVLDNSNPLHPVEIQEFALAGPPAGPFQLALDSRGAYLYVVTQKTLDVFPPEANALHALNIASDGTIATQTERLVVDVFPSAPQGVVAR